MPLFAFGGAGPVHACEVATLLQSSEVIVPPQPSVLSAFGTLVTSVRLDLVRSDLSRIGDLDWARVDRILASLREEAWRALAEAGCAADGVTLIFAADLRYLGQQSELTIALDADPRSHHDASRIVSRVRGGLSQALRRQPVACADRARDLAGHRARSHHPVQPGHDPAERARPRPRP